MESPRLARRCPPARSVARGLRDCTAQTSSAWHVPGIHQAAADAVAAVGLACFRAGVTFDKFLRAQVAVILFAGAYIAEIIRGGLQSLPKGQFEAADAMGLNYVQKTALIVLPQALRVVIPPLINTFIGFFKDTSLVLIIGIFDFLNTANQALVDPAWAGYPGEVYLFAAFVYFVFCYSMSRYSKYLEVELNKGTRR
jgi:general L-amino acid transport system permease protein